jgi:large subunit ribosomal protein L36e
LSIQKTTPVESKARISRSKGRLSRRTAFVREIVKEVAGLAPYERRVVELLRNSQDKRARKLAKKRVRSLSQPQLFFFWLQTNEFIQLGTIGRAKAKVDEMQKVIAEARRAGH